MREDTPEQALWRRLVVQTLDFQNDPSSSKCQEAKIVKVGKKKKFDMIMTSFREVQVKKTASFLATSSAGFVAACMSPVLNLIIIRCIMEQSKCRSFQVLEHPLHLVGGGAYPLPTSAP